ncbi:phenylacetaldoxime dehydratase family protein [Mycolicibacterium goodii]|uniref:phenylacetaldoxime dehydratase family protein n=1 Tax=Mycolicibacterium goodii TaxID=134601 RepID=UPI001BDBC091|nr:phenylacetaldoxime dehydratase family protein [Mycolicibacterium goodii]MBU8829751.1 phenylacetaldoxime dehydratase family protein [Mycolicibacterium goodii]
MESAISEHLVRPRMCPARHPDGYEPPYATRVGRIAPDVESLVMMYFGVQTPSGVATGLRALTVLDECLGRPGGPAHWDRAVFEDQTGTHNVLTVAYWSSASAFEQWRVRSGFDQWWQSDDRIADGPGYYLEVLTPDVARLELSLFASPWEREGAAKLTDTISGDVREHAYWGSIFDRIPAAQDEWLKPSGVVVVDSARSRPSRIVVAPTENACIIRSGQDWTRTSGIERSLYTDRIHPKLVNAMIHLRDSGMDLGCFSCRMVHRVDDTGKPVDKTYGTAIFRSLDHLAVWAGSHHTHEALYAAFMQTNAELDFRLEMSAYHEVAVLTREQQSYEYVNCHPQTGMLNAVSAG